jgi:serine/threonine-protein kinase
MRSELDRELWDRIAGIFERALEVTGPERAALLSQLCGSDLTIRREVEEMLAADDRAGGVIDEQRLAAAGRDQPFLDATLPEGARAGAYRIVSLIGAGGMGDVYRAERADGAYRQAVALKVLRPGYRTAELVRRFRVEREALARLVHPGIARILDGGALDDGRPYIVLELVDGTAITNYCEREALSLRDRLALFLKVASTVQFAHGRLVVHRDIKPSNILVQADGTPRLLDFGIAKLLDMDGTPSLAVQTTPDVRLLTPEYAAPEQLRGELPSTATDVYALGVLLFELLTGQKPFAAAGRTAAALEREILETPAPAPSSVVAARAAARSLRGDLDRIVLMALRKEPDRRYVSAAQLGEDVERWLAGRPVLARPDSVGYRVGRFVARNRALVAGGVALGLLLAGFGATATVQARRIARERDRAERERIAADDVLAILTGLFERADPNKHPGGDTLRVTSLLDDAEREVERLSDDPARQAALWRAVGRMRAARGDFERAIALLTRAYERRRALYGPDDVEAARVHHEIARVVHAYRGDEPARPLMDSSLTELRRLLGEDHEDVRAAMSDLLTTTADSVAARALLERLLELERRAPSRDPIALADRFDARGAARFGARRYDEAAALFSASLNLLQRQLPPTHQYIRTERQNLAMALMGQGQLARAESLQRVALKAEDAIASPASARAMAREALALTLARAGRPDSAERYEREALALFREGTAPGHWRIWSALRNLAFIVAARGRVAEGLALLDTAAALAGAAGDARAGEAAAYLSAQRVPLLLRLERVTEASRSLAAAERGLGASPAVTAAHRADVHRYAGTIALASGNASQAVERFRLAVALAEPPGEPTTVPGIHSCLLGVGLAQLGRATEARPLLEGACPKYELQGMADPLIVQWIAAARTLAQER